ncbi:flavin reductase family protein [Streptacidiphilus jiangxiensis]|uniref:NADH-FMN oxidoreductase RutF, flavin reductase (DIM6/NTAB) family n=1 Tax=Streptacidiphilus jiangxiensis TaxID=235985 RepID=A0A1H7JSC3_STRJI|nr:flavin reductase family protein [Streptacidiphilus jiangxiensis]SEK77236.1 NADH-FMN oxidoreductase RutF, flavin reductase (DIM6/NTAB) family [Streptacidiphilus jiangxiensis]
MQQTTDDHSVEISPAILYFGTPVVLVGTRNEDGSPHLAPISSVFWLGHRAVIGLGGNTHTLANLRRERACVLNLPSVEQADAVDRIARTTGASPVPERKVGWGYRHERDKFGLAGLTPAPGRSVDAPRALECPVQMEAEVAAFHSLAADDPERRGHVWTVELEVVRVHVAEEIRLPGHANRIDPDRWRPLIMSFQQFYGLGPQVRPSRLAGIEEELYRTPSRVPSSVG